MGASGLPGADVNDFASMPREDCGEIGASTSQGQRMTRHEYAVLLGMAMLIGVLFAGSLVLFARRKSASALLQLLGSGCLALAVVTHVSETFHLFPAIHWGSHYVGLGTAALGLILFPLGYLGQAVAKQSS